MATYYKKSREDGCCSVNFLKYVLFIFNFIFFLAGCAVLGVGIWTVISKHEYISLLSTSTYAVIAYLLIAAGILTIIVSIVGFVGVVREDRCALLLYTFMLLLIFLMEAVAGVMAYIYEEQVSHELQANLNETFLENYGFDDYRTEAIDAMQREFQCCGGVYYNDWQYSGWVKENILQSKRSSNPEPVNMVPESCCITKTPNCATSRHPSNIYQEPCSHKFAASIREHLIILGAVGLGICIVQIFGMIFSCCLYVQLKDYDDY